MRIGVVSDIHGNLAALEAVADALASAGVEAIVNLGDCVSGPLLPVETAHWLMRAGWPTIAGNHERQLLTLQAGGTGRSSSDRFAAARLDAAAWQWIATRLDAVEAPVICCGHTHLPIATRLEDDQLVLNPGSVGLQAFRETQGVPYVVEAGTPEARYAVLTCNGETWQATLHTVTYDFEAMARLAERHGAPDWAHALRTGHAPA